MTNPKHNQPEIEINEQFRHALDIMENSDRSIFITSHAGTGKSTLLNYFRDVIYVRDTFLFSINLPKFGEQITNTSEKISNLKT